jgi:hypothetical protein
MPGLAIAGPIAGVLILAIVIGLALFRLQRRRRLATPAALP